MLSYLHDEVRWCVRLVTGKPYSFYFVYEYTNKIDKTGARVTGLITVG